MVDSFLEERGHLAFQGLSLEPGLARRLPAELARRFHALPLAEERGRITVAMANPDDPVAREAIAAALGPAACVVQCDAQAIDSLLSQIWDEPCRRPERMLACGFPQSAPPAAMEYAQDLSHLLEIRLEWLSTAADLSGLEGAGTTAEPDLYFFQDTAHPLLRRLLSRAEEDGDRAGQACFPQAVLVARAPRWPLSRILLLLCGEERDTPAVDWVLYLAHRAESRVTVLAVVPPLPAMYGQRAGLGAGLPGLLTANSPLGRQMRQVAGHLTAGEIEATLRLREGPPEVQIRREVIEGDYDLVAVAGRPASLLRRCFQGEGVADPFHWTDRPILIARPLPAQLPAAF